MFLSLSSGGGGSLEPSRSDFRRVVLITAGEVVNDSGAEFGDAVECAGLEPAVHGRAGRNLGPGQFCLLFKDLAEVINIEKRGFTSRTISITREGQSLESGGGSDPQEHEDWMRAVNFSIQVPRVIRLLRYDLFPKNVVKFNRRNIFLRDENKCQYCGHRFSTQHLESRSCLCLAAAAG